MKDLRPRSSFTSVDVSLRCTVPSVADAQPATARTFRTFRKLSQAVTFIQSRDEEAGAKLRRAAYGADPRDVRFVVNFHGSVPRSRMKLGRTRWIMRNGITVDRLLPVPVLS